MSRSCDMKDLGAADKEKGMNINEEKILMTSGAVVVVVALGAFLLVGGTIKKRLQQAIHLMLSN